MAIRFAPIRSKDDLDSYLAATVHTTNPFDSLSDFGKQRFLDSLMFNSNGLASFQFADLEYELTPTDIYKILYLFGMQHLVPKMKNARIDTRVDEVLMQKPEMEMRIEENKILKRGGYIEPVLPIQRSCGQIVMGFGFGSGTNACDSDKDGYRCVGTGSCKKSANFICTSNC